MGASIVTMAMSHGIPHCHPVSPKFACGWHSSSISTWQTKMARTLKILFYCFVFFLSFLAHLGRHGHPSNPPCTGQVDNDFPFLHAPQHRRTWGVTSAPRGYIAAFVTLLAALAAGYSAEGSCRCQQAGDVGLRRHSSTEACSQSCVTRSCEFIVILCLFQIQVSFKRVVKGKGPSKKNILE